MSPETLRHFANDIDIGEHPGLHRGRPQILGERIDLRTDEIDGNRRPAGDAARVLRSNGGNDRCAENAEPLKRLEIGLNASTAAGIGSGDGEGNSWSALSFRPRSGQR